jgi:hypothetical protein
MQISGRNATSALEDATTQLGAGMEAARRGGESLPQLRAIERQILRNWASGQNRLFQIDPTLTLDRRQAHGEHVVGFDPEKSDEFSAVKRSGCMVPYSKIKNHGWHGSRDRHDINQIQPATRLPGVFYPLKSV